MANATDFFDNLGKTISRTADMVAKKTDEFISVQKLRGRRNVLEARLDDAFKRIGETVYEGREDNTEDTDEIDRLCGIIDGLRKEIAECRAEIAARKGEKICPSCGANVPKEACFCMRCGYSVAEEESGTENAGKEPEEESVGDNTEEKTVNAEEAEQSEGGETAEAMKDTETKEEEK